MTRKDYERIARVLSIRVSRLENNIDAGTQGARADKYMEIFQIAHALGNSFAEDNPRFDKDKFIRACGF